MSTVNMRELSRNTKSVIEDVVRSGKPAIVTINGRPQVAVTPLVGAVEAAEQHLLRNAPSQIQEAIREAEADLVSGRVSLVDDGVFANAGRGEERSAADVLAALAAQVNATALEEAIRSASESPNAVDIVRQALKAADLLTIGDHAREVSEPDRQTESDIVTYTLGGDESQHGIMLPAFTRVDILRSALIRNPAWQSLDVLRVSGRELAQNVDPNVTIVIDPWSDLEFRVPRSDRRTVVTEEPVVAAAEIVSGVV